MGPNQAQMLLLATTLLCAGCEPPPAPSGQYGVPGGNNFGGGYGQDEHQDYVDSQPKSYEFGYAVKDAASGNDFGRREQSDGETVRGEYRVQLPDGRTQIVSYTADWRTGFHADVRYEGVAQYPEQYASQGYDYAANNLGPAGGSAYNQASNYNQQQQQQQQQQGYNYNQLGSIDNSYGAPPQTGYGVPFH